MWEECGFPHIVTPGGFVDPMPQHLAIMEFLNFTRPLPPALRHQTRSGFRDGHFNASVKHLHGLTSKEVDRYFRPRLIQELLQNGIAVRNASGSIFIQGRNADNLLTDQYVCDWLRFRIDEVLRLSPSTIDTHRNKIVARMKSSEFVSQTWRVRHGVYIERSPNGVLLINGQCTREVLSDDCVRWDLVPGILLEGDTTT